MDVSVERGRVVGYLDPDVPGVHFSLALERFLDLRLHPLSADRRIDRDVAGNADNAANVADHPLYLTPLVVILDLARERHPAALDPGVDLAGRDLGIRVKDVADGARNVRVVRRFSGEADLNVVGDRPDAIDPRGGASCCQLLGICGRVPRQYHRAVLDRDADGVRIAYLRIPPQLADHILPDFGVGLHRHSQGACASTQRLRLTDHSSVTCICRGLAASDFGTVTVRIPSCSFALTWSGLTSPGRYVRYSNRPIRRELRCRRLPLPFSLISPVMASSWSCT